MGGCCHDEVAKHFPELAKFIPLHCSNHYGAPMCPVANGIYHIIKGGMSVAMKYLRISEQECVELYIASEDELYFKYLLFSLGIVDRWNKAKMLKKRAEICERYDKKIRQAEAEKKIILCVFDYGLSTDNVIYYSHTNTLSFNWNGYGEKITQEEFDDFVNKVDRSQLPEDIRFELK